MPVVSAIEEPSPVLLTATAVRLTASELALKRLLDNTYLQMNTADFILPDPIFFAHEARLQRPHYKALIELTAFWSALFAFGRRDVILPTLIQVWDRMDGDPIGFLTLSSKVQTKAFKGFGYRFYQGADVVYLAQRLAWVYEAYGDLEGLFRAMAPEELEMPTGIPEYSDERLLHHLTLWLNALRGEPPLRLKQRNGLKFMVPDPAKGGACKRIWMFLRWMVRSDNVDLGLWQALSPPQLRIPLDTHVASVARRLNLIDRNANDGETVRLLTQQLRRFDPDDPVKYDLALFGVAASGGRLELL